MGVLRTNNLPLQVGRCLVHSLGTGMWFLALPLVPLAEITAISFTSPIFLAIGAMLFFGEKVRSERWIAIGVGFLGVMIVLYPKLERSSMMPSHHANMPVRRSTCARSRPSALPTSRTALFGR